MASPVDLDKIVSSFAELHSGISDALATETDPAAREYLQGIADQMKTVEEKYVSAFRSVTAEIEQANNKNRQAIQKVQSTIAAAKDEAAALEKAKKGAKRFPPLKKKKAAEKVEVDPNLGKKLREELLERFGNGKSAGAGPRTELPAWEDWLEGKETS